MHSIRLRGPWECKPLERDGPGPLPSPCRVTMPCDWGDSLGHEFRGLVRFRRWFNRPTGLEAHERVWIVVESVDATASVTLNGHPLGEIPLGATYCEFDITALLQPRNELLVEVGCPADASLRPTDRGNLPGGLIGEVGLEIRGM